MLLHPIDVGIVCLYFLAMLAIGFIVEKRASRGIDSYFLAENRMPWWLLSLSNAASMFDISGTMWLVYLLFVYGMKSVYIPWLWPVFNQIFLMVYLSPWMRRSAALTGGQWITLRFGNGRGAEAARLSVVFFATASVIGFTSYAFVGIAKFSAVFLPDTFSPNTYGAVIVAFTTVYTVMGGLYSVVLTDLVQYTLVTIACVAIGWIAISRVDPATLAAMTPAGWADIGVHEHLGLDWSTLMPQVSERIAKDGYEAFAAVVGLMVFKGVLVSAAGPAPNYDMQRILATRGPREAALMSGCVSLVLFFPRYFMVAGITVLALVFLGPEIAKSGVDFEQVLPLVIQRFVPVGLSGLLIAGLLAAFMSNFAGTINAAAAYLVNDVAKRYLWPNEAPKTYVRMSYAASILVVVLGCGFGLFMRSINEITVWIVSALWGGYAAPNLLKWHWWRMNGHGYFWGMIAGIAGALVVAALPSLSPLQSFPILFLISLAGSIAGSLLTEPEDETVVLEFYRRTRPWGVWGPMRDKLPQREQDAGSLTPQPLRDGFNILVGIAWQTSLIALPIYIVIQSWSAACITAAVSLCTTAILKFNWYDGLSSETTPVELARPLAGNALDAADPVPPANP
jgi:Na+/proline symporter